MNTPIRIATPADVKFIESLQRKFSNQIGFLPNPAIAAYLNKGAYHLAQENADPAGFILVNPVLKWQPLLASVTQAAVAMDAQRRHHGLALLDHARHAATAAGLVGIQAICRVGLESNEFWSAAGFKPICHLHGTNARNKDLIVWRLPLVKKLPLWFAAPPTRAGWRARTPRLDRDPTRSTDANNFARRYISARNGTTPKAET